MSTHNETKAIIALITAYAEALNSGNARTIGGFYTADGAILPNGHNTVQKKQLNQISGEFLKKTNFKIDYHAQNVTISGDYAFVESVATTTSTSKNLTVNKTTRDLFILRQDQGAWKIYRYIFNDTK